jgi:hypothetical protein
MICSFSGDRNYRKCREKPLEKNTGVKTIKHALHLATEKNYEQ